MASAVAASAALLGLIVTLTSTARLRRQEQTFRDAMQSFADGAPQRLVLVDLHRAVTAQLVARRLTPSWRFIWPWLAWLTFFGSWLQAGYSTAQYVASDGALGYYELSAAVLGDPFSAPILPVLVFIIGPFIYRSYVLALTSRANIATDFFHGNAVRRAPSLSSLTAARDNSATVGVGPRTSTALKRYHNLVEPYWPSVLPSLLPLTFGFFLGVTLWTRNQDGDLEEVFERIGGLPAFTIVAFALVATGTALAIARTQWRLRSHRLPSHYPVVTPLVSRTSND